MTSPMNEPWKDWPSITGSIYSLLGSMILTELADPSNHRRFLNHGGICYVSFCQKLQMSGTRQPNYAIQLPLPGKQTRFQFVCEIENNMGWGTTLGSNNLVLMQRYDGAVLGSAPVYHAFNGFYEV